MGSQQPNLDALRKVFTATGTAGNACVLTIPAVSGDLHVLEHVEFSYDSDPAVGSTITATTGAETLLDHFVTNGGPGQFNFDSGGRHGSESTRGSSIVITLAASAGRTGKISVGIR